MTNPYRLREHFLSSTEQNFYHALDELLCDKLVSEPLVICLKVALSDLITVTRPNENVHYFNKLHHKTVDFLLIHRISLHPVLAIELDYPKQTHHGEDKFLEGVFQSGNLPFVRITVQEKYDLAILSARIKHAIEKTDPSQIARNQQDFSPICPKCGITMVLRFYKTGDDTGKKYYGCMNYPVCKETMPIPS
jgi:hypothetical protein